MIFRRAFTNELQMVVLRMCAIVLYLWYQGQTTCRSKLNLKHQLLILTWLTQFRLRTALFTRKLGKTIRPHLCELHLTLLLPAYKNVKTWGCTHSHVGMRQLHLGQIVKRHGKRTLSINAWPFQPVATGLVSDLPIVVQSLGATVFATTTFCPCIEHIKAIAHTTYDWFTN